MSVLHEAIQYSERPPLQGKILNLSSGESGVVTSEEAEAIIVGTLGENAFIAFWGSTGKDSGIGGGVNFESPQANQGNIKRTYQELIDLSQRLCDEPKPKRFETTVVWGKVASERNKSAVHKELKRLGIKEFVEFSFEKLPPSSLVEDSIVFHMDHGDFSPVDDEIRHQIGGYLLEMGRFTEEYTRQAVERLRPEPKT